jgi:hypothetical protein
VAIRARVARGGINAGLFSRFVNARNGPIRVDLDRRATNVQNFQLRKVPRRTGTLAATSRKRQGRAGLKPSVEVIIGKDGVTPYLGYVLFGTPAHEIRAIPNRPNAHLRFTQAGGVRYAKVVWHPGTAANPFVGLSLPEALK